MKGTIVFLKSEFTLLHQGNSYMVRFKNDATDGTIRYALFKGHAKEACQSGKYKFKKSAHKTDALNLLKDFLNKK